MVEYVNTGRIVLDARRNPKPVTYHDPCNLARSGGITGGAPIPAEALVSRLPRHDANRQENFCCSGGRGAMSMSEYSARRLQVAKVKDRPDRRDGGTTVATAATTAWTA